MSYLQIDNIGTWTEIYRLVYARYGLTDGENAVVEGTGRSMVQDGPFS